MPKTMPLEKTMPQIAARRRWPLALMLAAGLAGTMLALALALWAHYGSAIFYESLLSGIAACF